MTIEIPLSVLVALFAINGGTLTAFIGAIVFLALRLGRLPTREEHNELRQELKTDMAELRQEFRTDMTQLRQDLKTDMAELRQEFKTDMAELRQEFRTDMTQLRQEFRTDMTQLRQELRTDMTELREEFRRSHQQLMLALSGHAHNEDGQAVFIAPPELDATLTPADD